MTVSVLSLFLTVPWVGLQYVIVIIPNHTRFLFFDVASLPRFQMFGFILQLKIVCKSAISIKCYSSDDFLLTFVHVRGQLYWSDLGPETKPIRNPLINNILVYLY